MAERHDNALPSDELNDLDLADGAEGAAIDDGPHAEWFVIHSYSGMENKVKKNIEHRTESMGMTVRFGNNVFINLEPDTRGDADRLFAALVEGGKVDMPMQDMFWGGYFGSLTDRFGVQWMINHQPMPAPGAAA